jgi:hypothetical protein
LERADCIIKGPTGSVGVPATIEGLMDLAYFFAGTQSKEETSSAILATLLQYDDAFRGLFLGAVDCSPALDPASDWAVRVEDGRTGFRRFDVTLQNDATTIVVENKLAQNARRAGQLLEYYSACREAWPSHRLVALYLAPEISWGTQEIDDVLKAMADRETVAAADPDWAQAMSWGQVAQMIDIMPAPVSWFATSGLAQVGKAIDAAAIRVNRDWTAEQFLEAAAGGGPGAMVVIERALDWLSDRGLEPKFGRGATGPLYLALPRRPGDPDPVRLVKVYVPEGSVNLSYRKIKTAAPFDSVDQRIELIHRLNAIPGTAPIKDEYATESESSYIPNEVLRNGASLAAFFEVIDWVADLVTNPASEARPGP